MGAEVRDAMLGSEDQFLAGVMVTGFKSIERKIQLNFNRLTLLGGANSSGKSSIMQPLLLLKQTLEAEYDVPTFALDGASVKFDNREQLLSRGARHMTFGLQASSGSSISVTYTPSQARGRAFDIAGQSFVAEGRRFLMRPTMTSEQVCRLLSDDMRLPTEKVFRERGTKFTWRIVADRCFLAVGGEIEGRRVPGSYGYGSPGTLFAPLLNSVIHLPGLRGDPARSYAVANVTGQYKGRFDAYTASIIAGWQESEPERINQLRKCLLHLELTNAIQAEYLNDTRVELRVGRRVRGRPLKGDFVNIADVGFGSITSVAGFGSIARCNSESDRIFGAA